MNDVFPNEYSVEDQGLDTIFDEDTREGGGSDCWGCNVLIRL